MGKGRKVQRDWGKRSSLDQKKQRAFSNDGSRESGFEFSSKEKRRTESTGKSNGQLLAKSVLSRYASLLVITAGLVGLISFLMMYMRPTFKSEGNQSAISSVHTVPAESENKIEILTEGNSAFIEKNREVDFQFEEILELIKTMNEPNVSPEDIVEKYGKASSGSVDNRVEDSQLVLLSYKLTGRKGVVNMRLRSTGEEWSSIRYLPLSSRMLGNRLRRQLMIIGRSFPKVIEKEWKSSKPLQNWGCQRVFMLIKRLKSKLIFLV